MPALNFQKQFAADVESGKKRQTIRAYRKDKRDPKVGDTLYLYTGMRTKQCRKLGEVPCTSVYPFEIHSRFSMVIDGDTVGPLEREELAKEDGFVGSFLMTEWFKTTHGLPFEGLLIRWGEK